MNHVLNIDVDNNRYIYYSEDELNEFYFSYWQLLKWLHDHLILSIVLIKFKKMSLTTDDVLDNDDDLLRVRDVSKKSEFFAVKLSELEIWSLQISSFQRNSTS